MTIKRYYLRVYGLVQGVGFRYYAYRWAKTLGISGWVRNLDDGSVELEAEGEERELEEFIRRIEQGPSSAVVRKVVREEIPVLGERDFEIRF